MHATERLVRPDDRVEFCFEGDRFLIVSERIPSPMHRLVAGEEDRGHHLVYSPIDPTSQYTIHLFVELTFRRRSLAVRG